MKRIALLAAPLLVAGLLAGCGSSDSSGKGSSTTASSGKTPTTAQFCQPFVDMVREVSTKGATMSNADAVGLAKQLAAKLKDIGTPADMPADAKKGVDTLVNKMLALPDDATKDEIAATEDLTDEEKSESQALGTYIQQACASALLPSSSPSSAD